MNIREAVKDKENYNDIVSYFKTLKTLSIDQMVLLIDTIEQMSPEIYEHYRALQDIFRRELTTMLAHTPLDQNEQLMYILNKGCATRTLLAEKYESYLTNY